MYTEQELEHLKSIPDYTGSALRLRETTRFPNQSTTYKGSLKIKSNNNKQSKQKKNIDLSSYARCMSGLTSNPPPLPGKEFRLVAVQLVTEDKQNGNCAVAWLLCE